MILFRFSARIAMSACLVCLLSAILAQTALASPPPPPVSQPHINELAAHLLRAHRALIEEPGLRLYGERLEAYMERISLPLAGESGMHYRERTAAYVTALAQVANVRVLCTEIPALRDNSPANHARWREAVKASALLPLRVAKVSEAWRAERKLGAGAAAARHFGAELAQTVLIIKAAYEALRDARP